MAVLDRLEGQESLACLLRLLYCLNEADGKLLMAQMLKMQALKVQGLWA